MDIAECRFLADAVSLRDLLERYPGRRGARNVRRLFDANRIGLGVSKQELEHRLAAFVGRHALPVPDRRCRGLG